jgi:hypothetical protein
VPVVDTCGCQGVFLTPGLPWLPAAPLFAVYHVFSTWMVPIRIIALVPFVYLVWRTKSVTIGIIGHCLLNLVGDAIGTIPVVFG